MKTLAEFIAASEIKTKAHWAKEFDISRSYLSEILSGAKRPGRNTIAKIATATAGQVPPASWFDDQSPAP